MYTQVKPMKQSILFAQSAISRTSKKPPDVSDTERFLQYSFKLSDLDQFAPFSRASVLVVRSHTSDGP